MSQRQSASLDRKKLLADPVMVTTIVLLIVFLCVFILYPLAILLVDSVYSDQTGLTAGFFSSIFGKDTFGSSFVTALLISIPAGAAAVFLGLTLVTGEKKKNDGFVRSLCRVMPPLSLVLPILAAAA